MQKHNHFQISGNASPAMPLQGGVSGAAPTWENISTRALSDYTLLLNNIGVGVVKKTWCKVLTEYVPAGIDGRATAGGYAFNGMFIKKPVFPLVVEGLRWVTLVHFVNGDVVVILSETQTSHLLTRPIASWHFPDTEMGAAARWAGELQSIANLPHGVANPTANVPSKGRQWRRPQTQPTPTVSTAALIAGNPTPAPVVVASEVEAHIADLQRQLANKTAVLAMANQTIEKMGNAIKAFRNNREALVQMLDEICTLGNNMFVHANTTAELVAENASRHQVQRDFAKGLLIVGNTVAKEKAATDHFKEEVKDMVADAA